MWVTAMALAGPTGNGNIGEDSVGWGDSAVWIPYQLYLMYGDKTVLVEHYDTAKRWLEYSLKCMKEQNPMYADKPWYANGDGDYIYDTRFHYGEWNEPLPPAPEVIELFMNGGTAADFVTHMAKYGTQQRGYDVRTNAVEPPQYSLTALRREVALDVGDHKNQKAQQYRNFDHIVHKELDAAAQP